ncbi:E3 ubiquitin-protein ligase TRIM13-like [Macrobrachium nipponense]|uniref:E3 ubiquitin-protein ligase TRIM13-like n=1 Tax=Macrobrachium nipponense TaxID=159736 RepID=UPI0030C7ABCA
MASNPLECDICRNTYNDDHCPRILPCSHEFCIRCIEGLILTEKRECPLCRTEFSNSSAEELMISRGLLDAAKQLSSMPRGSRPSTSAPKKCIMNFTKDFQENLIGKAITVCRETEAEVKARTESNYRLQNELEGFTQMLAEIKFPSQDTLSNIDEDNKELMNKLDIMQREQVNVKESERKLETATDSASAGATIGEAGQLLLSVEKTASEITQLLQENDRRRDDLRQDALRIKGTYADAMKALGRIIEELEGEDSVVNITVTDLRSPHSRLRGDAQREIFAVMTFEGTLRVAPVKIEPNNEVSVPHLDEGVLPPRCFVIELESLMTGGPFLSSF